jgi:Protein kinase domain
MVFCLTIPAILIIPLIIYSCVIGVRAWRASKQVTGEQRQVLRTIALNLCEPLVGTPLAIATLALFSNLPFMRIESITLVLICWPMLLLLWPWFGARIHDAKLQAIALYANKLGVARLIMHVLCFGLFEIANDHRWLIVLIFGLPLASIGTLFYTIQWADDLLKGFLAPPAAPLPPLPPISPLPAQQANNARPAPKHVLLQSKPVVATHENAVPCPECSELVATNALLCEHCGVVFASKIPIELRSLARYDLLRPLNEGGMSQIYLAHDRASMKRCVVKVAISADSQRCLAHEAQLLQTLNHAGIVSLLGWYPEATTPFVALEYLAGGSFEHQINHRPLPLAKVIRLSSSVAQTLCYLASRPVPVVHCDLKPANLIADQQLQRATLIDFGSALVPGQHLVARSQADTYGTPGYAGPEQYRGTPHLRSDVYGLAATIYHLATADDPTTHPLSFPMLANLPADLAQLLQQALAHDPEQRPTAFHMRNVLREMAYAHR